MTFSYLSSVSTVIIQVPVPSLLSGRNIVSEFCIYRVHIPFKLSSVTNLTYQLRRTAFSWQEMGDSRKYQGYRADGPRYECGTVSGESPQWLECMSPQTCC
jgi:hypothetical protein